MQSSEILQLYDYNYWANRRILEAAANMPKPEFMSPKKVSHGSLRGTIIHVLSAEWVWRTRCQEGVSPPGLLDERDFPTVESIRERFQAEETLMRAFLNTLTDADLSQEVSYTTTKGRPFATVMWHILLHIVNHGTQFRAEAAVILSEYGHSPGDLDFILYVRERL